MLARQRLDVRVGHVRPVRGGEDRRAEEAGVDELAFARALLVEEGEADAAEQMDRRDVIAERAEIPGQWGCSVLAGQELRSISTLHHDDH